MLFRFVLTIIYAAFEAGLEGRRGISSKFGLRLLHRAELVLYMCSRSSQPLRYEDMTPSTSEVRLHCRCVENPHFLTDCELLSYSGKAYVL